MPPAIEITQGFPEKHREAAARLYDDAFGQKLAQAIPDRAARLRVLTQALDTGHAFAAVRGELLLGIAGFKTAASSFTGGLTPRLLRKELGLPGSLRALGFLALLERPLAENQLLMDGISVAAAARGEGIGTQLLEALKNFGRAGGYKTLRLDVIDTNPDARRLYERLGFVATRTTRFGPLKWLLGFGAATTMLFDLGGKERATPSPASP